MARHTQAIHGYQAIHGWPGSAVGPEQIPFPPFFPARHNSPDNIGNRLKDRLRALVESLQKEPDFNSATIRTKNTDADGFIKHTGEKAQLRVELYVWVEQLE